MGKERVMKYGTLVLMNLRAWELVAEGSSTRDAAAQACREHDVRPTDAITGGASDAAPERTPRDLDLLRRAMDAGEWVHLQGGTAQQYRKPGGNPGFCHSKIGACGISFESYNVPRYWAKGIGVTCEACFAAAGGVVAPPRVKEGEEPPAWMAAPAREPGDEREDPTVPSETEELPF